MHQPREHKLHCDEYSEEGKLPSFIIFVALYFDGMIGVSIDLFSIDNELRCWLCTVYNTIIQ